MCSGAKCLDTGLHSPLFNFRGKYTEIFSFHLFGFFLLFFLLVVVVVFFRSIDL